MATVAKSVFDDTARQLQERAVFNDAVLVGYSGGKDSLCITDLCCRTFRRVVGFYLYFVPGLEVVRRQLEYGRERWGIEILEYPDYALLRNLRNNIFCNTPPAVRSALPEWGREDLFDVIMHDTGIGLLATGEKEADFWQRRAKIKNAKGGPVFYPLRKWSKFDVVAYLKVHQIPLPDSSGQVTNGIDLGTKSLLWLADNYPGDFDRVKEWFPYVDAVVKRREWYGVE